MIDVIKLLIQAGFEPDCASKEWHERMDRFAALLLEEAAKIAEAKCFGVEDYASHDMGCQNAAEAIRAAKPTEKT